MRRERVSEAGTSVTIANGVGPARGILSRRAERGEFWHSRTAPREDMRELVEHFWIVRWDLLGGPPLVRETLPHPSVHVIIARAQTRIQGPQSGRFSRVLEGRGCVFGIKFKPAGFHPFLRAPVSTLLDRALPLQRVFGAAAEGLEREILCREADDTAMIDVATTFLEAHWPASDPAVARVNSIVAGIVDDRSLASVAELGRRHGLDKRSLQPLFRRYVGVGSKWVINRYRLHEAVEQLAQGLPVNWTAVALELGYFDHAHFIRDFKTLVGRTPAAFARDESAPNP